MSAYMICQKKCSMENSFVPNLLLPNTKNMEKRRKTTGNGWTDGTVTIKYSNDGKVHERHFGSRPNLTCRANGSNCKLFIEWAIVAFYSYQRRDILLNAIDMKKKHYFRYEANLWLHVGTFHGQL